MSAAWTDVRALARPVGDGFAPYALGGLGRRGRRAARRPRAKPSSSSTRTRRRCRASRRFRSRRAWRRLHEYPDGTYRALREAAAAYAGVAAENVVVGAGADDLILLVARVVPRPRHEGRDRRRRRTRSTGSRRRSPAPRWSGRTDGATVRWVCNPNNPTGETTSPEEIVELAHRAPETIVVVDEAYVEYGGTSCAPWVDEAAEPRRAAHPVEGVRLRRAPRRLRARAPGHRRAARRASRAGTGGRAGRRDRRRGPPRASPRRRRDHRCGARARADRPPRGRLTTARRLPRTSCSCAPRSALADRLEAQGIVVRAFPEGIRISVRRPSENDVLLRALGAEPGPALGRDATVLRTTTETALRLTLDLDGSGRTRVETGIGFLDHLLTLLAFHASFDLELVAGGDLRWTSTTRSRTCSPPSAPRSPGARHARGGGALRLGDRADGRGARVRGSRPRPQGARRDHTGLHRRARRRARGLAPRACARAVRDGGRLRAVHVESSGADDHHVAEAAFKALGQALRQAVVPGGVGIRSTKGAA